MRLISRTLNQLQSPIGSAARLLREYTGNRPLLDLSQGTPNYATAPVIANRIAEVALDPDGGKYTARPGLETLRDLLSQEISQAYAGRIQSDQILITAGCNQAFCVAISALAGYGDEVILPVPYYFNHDMWLRLEGVHPVYLKSGSHFIPDPRVAATLVSPKTRAIVLVTPGNPTGVTIPPPVIHAFADLARRNGIMLILDETYRVFRTSEDPAHDLFAQTQWDETVVSLHSFSKEFAIPGHRVGAAIGHPDLIVEMMKLFDCMAICAPRLGQEAAIEALRSAKEWRRDRVLEIRAKQARFEAALTSMPGGFELCAAGAFYGWVRHPWTETADQAVRRLALDSGILVLPGTIFSPTDDRCLRFSFGNLSNSEIDAVGVRLHESA
jgi:aspartate/methionine/tyrosine aminotransferase